MTCLSKGSRAFTPPADAADRMRGRAMVEAAITGFRALEMVLHAKLAEEFLRDWPPSS